MLELNGLVIQYSDYKYIAKQMPTVLSKSISNKAPSGAFNRDIRISFLIGHRGGSWCIL